MDPHNPMVRTRNIDEPPKVDPALKAHIEGDADGLGLIRGMLSAAAITVIIATIVAALCLDWGSIRLRVASTASTVADYLHTGPGCPGADYGWLGRCSEAPKRAAP